ncbi:MAG: flavodoxin-dependent (E)-4-hydroxy-3-methylbut-2-enyl-diphosphate synthase [Candidatus Limiplasma sp.]|nr:flavodoxin-dependent (E)-4-hydroxy-3-methylbut-2-enyl-diphosphate synthase [Candidatus Limiplasma sp.]
MIKPNQRPCAKEASMRNTRSFFIGTVPIGGGSPVTIQSMTNTDTRDAAATLKQVRALAKAGCDIVRVSVYDEDCLPAVAQLVRQSSVPLVADIHFRADLAVGAMERGIAKVRINPGNIGSSQGVRRVADCAKAHKIPLRIGVNSGSIEKDILRRDGGVTARGMVDSALAHARLLEKEGFHDIVLSLKASSVPLTVAAYQLAAQETDYPLHVGITEAGLPGAGNIKSAVGIGALLLQDIGDTIRVSLTGSPLPEAKAAIDILQAVGLRQNFVNIISCPTCGRTGVDVAAIAKRVQEELSDLRVPLTVAVMGCVVNGPGEAREADVGLAGGGLAAGTDGGEAGSYAVGALFEKGKPPQRIQGDLAGQLIARAREIAKAKEGLV